MISSCLSNALILPCLDSPLHVTHNLGYPQFPKTPRRISGMAAVNPAPVPQPDPNAGYDASEETGEGWLRVMTGKDKEWKNVGTSEQPSWLLDTKCPRCGHAISNRIQPMVILRLRGSLGAQQSDVWVECNCSSPHA